MMKYVMACFFICAILLSSCVQQPDVSSSMLSSTLISSNSDSISQSSYTEDNVTFDSSDDTLPVLSERIYQVLVENPFAEYELKDNPEFIVDIDTYMLNGEVIWYPSTSDDEVFFSTVDKDTAQWSLNVYNYKTQEWIQFPRVYIGYDFQEFNNEYYWIEKTSDNPGDWYICHWYELGGEEDIFYSPNEIKSAPRMQIYNGTVFWNRISEDENGDLWFEIFMIDIDTKKEEVLRLCRVGSYDIRSHIVDGVMVYAECDEKYFVLNAFDINRRQIVDSVKIEAFQGLPEELMYSNGFFYLRCSRETDVGTYIIDTNTEETYPITNMTRNVTFFRDHHLVWEQGKKLYVFDLQQKKLDQCLNLTINDSNLTTAHEFSVIDNKIISRVYTTAGEQKSKEGIMIIEITPAC